MSVGNYHSLTGIVQKDMVEHLIREIEAMLEWGLTNGMDIPSELAESFFSILTELRNPSEGKDQAGQEPLSDEILLNFYSDDIGDLVAIHASLKKIIQPAKPRTVALMYHQRRHSKISTILGPIPIIRQLVIMALVFIFIMYGMSFFKDVTIDNINLSILDDDSFGTVQLKNQAFLLACAGLGSVFSCLFLAMRYVTEGTYDPKYNASYWVRIILGLMAGLIMVELIPESVTKGEGSFMADFGKPTMALLGGFSATVVHRLLQKIVDMLGAMIDQLPGDGIRKKDNQVEPVISMESESTPWENRLQSRANEQRMNKTLERVDPVIAESIDEDIPLQSEETDDILPAPKLPTSGSTDNATAKKISLRRRK